MEPVPAAVHVTLQGARGVGLDSADGSSAWEIAAVLSKRLLCLHRSAHVSAVCILLGLLQWI